MRSDIVADWVARSEWAGWKRIAMTGDASARRYERLCSPNGTTVILMDAPPETCGSQGRFVEIAAHLKMLGLAAPEVLACDEASGLLMLSDLGQAGPGDVVLLHGCCHNPSGADLNREQWHAVADLMARKGLIPFVDMAYQGLGNGLEEDAYGVRLLAERFPEMLVATSCSKNVGLYRERTGTLFIVAATPAEARTAGSQLFSKIRSHYSMPPAHGAAIVETILADAGLTASWERELAAMRVRIQGLRQQLVAALAASGIDGDFAFIQQQFGMFSFLGITPQQVDQLRQDYSIYMINSSRMNVAGLNQGSIDYFVSALTKVLSAR